MRAVLLIAVICAVALPFAIAQTDPSVLYNLAKQAQIEVEIQISESSPSEAAVLLEQGTNRTEFILNSTTNEEAAEHFLAAMEHFEEAFRLIDEGTSTEEAIQPDHSEVLERMTRYYDQLKYLASVYDLDTDYTELDSMFAQARTQLDNDEPGVAQTLESVQHMVDVLRERVGVAAAEDDAARALQYAARYVEQLDRLVAGADALEVPSDVVSGLQQIRDQLDSATDSALIISLIREAISIKENLDLEERDRLEVWIWQVENTITRLYGSDVLGHIEYNAATISLDKCKSLVADGDLSKADARLGQLNDWLFNLEQP